MAAAPWLPRQIMRHCRSSEVFTGEIETAWGAFRAAWSKTGLCHLSFPGEPRSLLDDWLRRRAAGAAIRRDAAAPKDLVRALERYIRGGPAPDLPLDLRVPEFTGTVLVALRQIPFGEVRAYADIAARVRRPKATRAVGQACGANPVPIFIPCHRVVGRDGSMTGFGAGLRWKERLLAHEGSPRRPGAGRTLSRAS